MKITVVIATYNEASNIKQLLDGLKDYNVIIVDDCSPDGTGEIAETYPNVTVYRRAGKSGIASAYFEGLSWALRTTQSDYYIQMDAGLTHDPREISGMVKYASMFGADLVIGSRFILNDEFKGYRTIISKTAAFLMSYVLNKQITDCTSGYRCWKKELLEEMISKGKFKSKGFAFQLESLYRAKDSYALEYPIEYELTNSSFKFSMLWEALQIWFGFIKEKYGI